MFDILQLLTVCREEFERMARGFDCGLSAGAPMERCAVHDQDAGRWQHGYKMACSPKVEDVRINIALSQPNAALTL